MIEIVFFLLIIATEVAIIRVNLSPLGECSFLRGIVHPRVVAQADDPASGR
jgi:hypothetical protein